MYDIPDLHETSIESLTVWFYLLNDELEALPGFDLNYGDAVAWEDEETLWTAKIENNQISVELNLDPIEQTVMARISISHEPEFSIRSEGREVPPDELWVGISSWLNEFRRNIHSRARFLIPVQRLPAHGFVHEALAVQTVAGGERLVMKGSQWAIKGYPDDDIAWSLNEYDNHLHGSLARLTHQEPGRRNLLTDELHVAVTRLNRIVLEQG